MDCDGGKKLPYVHKGRGLQTAPDARKAEQMVVYTLTEQVWNIPFRVVEPYHNLSILA